MFLSLIKLFYHFIFAINRIHILMSLAYFCFFSFWGSAWYLINVESLNRDRIQVTFRRRLKKNKQNKWQYLNHFRIKPVKVLLMMNKSNELYFQSNADASNWTKFLWLHLLVKSLYFLYLKAKWLPLYQIVLLPLAKSQSIVCHSNLIRRQN